LLASGFAEIHLKRRKRMTNRKPKNRKPENRKPKNRKTGARSEVAN